MSLHRRLSSSNVAVASVKRRLGGAWVNVQEIKRRVSGSWVTVWSALAFKLSNRSVFSNNFGATATATVTFYNDGRFAYQEAPSAQVVVADEWMTPRSTTEAAKYQIRATRLSGGTPSGTLGSWLALSSSRSWSISRAASGTAETVLRFEIRNATTLAVVATADITLTATYEV